MGGSFSSCIHTVLSTLHCNAQCSDHILWQKQSPSQPWKRKLCFFKSPHLWRSWNERSRVSTGQQMPTEISISPQANCFLTWWNRSKFLPDLEVDIPLLLKCRHYATILRQALFYFSPRWKSQRRRKKNDGCSQPHFYPKPLHGHLTLEAPRGFRSSNHSDKVYFFAD